MDYFVSLCFSSMTNSTWASILTSPTPVALGTGKPAGLTILRRGEPPPSKGGAEPTSNDIELEIKAEHEHSMLALKEQHEEDCAECISSLVDFSAEHERSTLSLKEEYEEDRAVCTASHVEVSAECERSLPSLREQYEKGCAECTSSLIELLTNLRPARKAACKEISAEHERSLLALEEQYEVDCAVCKAV